MQRGSQWPPWLLFKAGFLKKLISNHQYIQSNCCGQLIRISHSKWWSLLYPTPTPALPIPRLLNLPRHLALHWLKDTEAFHGGDRLPKLSSHKWPSVAPLTGASLEWVTFLSRCPDTGSWSSCVGHKAWFPPKLDRWHYAGSSQCRFLHVWKIKVQRISGRLECLKSNLIFHCIIIRLCTSSKLRPELNM